MSIIPLQATATLATAWAARAMSIHVQSRNWLEELAFLAVMGSTCNQMERDKNEVRGFSRSQPRKPVLPPPQARGRREVTWKYYSDLLRPRNSCPGVD